LAYELPDGRLKLIDGHLRRDMDPNMKVEVEVLDVNDAEARALLLSIDPLAELAQNQAQLELTPTVSADLRLAWEMSVVAALDQPRPPFRRDVGDAWAHEFYVLIKCRDEQHQGELLERFHSEGLDCQAKLC
jgi:hypothetical protein